MKPNPPPPGSCCQSYQSHQSPIIHSNQSSHQSPIIHPNHPSFTPIPPIESTDRQVRNTLVRKCKDLTRLMLDLAARVTRNRASRISRAFESISSKIHEPVKKIEELVALREAMMSIPAKSRGFREEIDELMADYEVLEEFRYSLPPEDFGRRWDALGWPRRLDEQLDRCVFRLFLFFFFFFFFFFLCVCVCVAVCVCVCVVLLLLCSGIGLWSRKVPIRFGSCSN